MTPMLSYNQITVTSNNLPDIGDTVITAYDYGTYLPGNSGPNQNWNFSNVAGTPEMILGFIDPVSTPYQSTFPLSNLCVQIDTLTYYYLNRSINGLSAVGFVDSGMVYPYNQIILPTPLNYLDTIISTSILYQMDTVLIPPAPAFFFLGIPGPYLIDSIKVISGNYNKYIVDSWGQLQLPTGSFDALRLFESTYEFDNTSFRLVDTITGAVQWVQDTSSTGFYWESSRYSWRTDNPTVNWSLLEMETDSLGNSYGEINYYLGNSLSNIVISPAIVDIDKLVDVSCNGLSDGLIILDIVGTAYPFTFSWSNGSNTKDIFNLSAGTYTVTVTDANGNISIETYVIDEPPPISLSINQSGYTLTANVNGGIPPYQYLWIPGQNGDTLQDLIVTNSGQYTCFVTDKTGCADQITSSFITVGLLEFTSKKKLIRVVNVLGKQVYQNDQDQILFYIYDDGTVESKIIIE